MCINLGRLFTAMVCCFGVAVLAGACIAETEPAPSTTQAVSLELEAPVKLNTFISDYLEIDQLGSQPPDDANLFTGLDPADGTLSAKKPGPGTGDYIDWQDLGTDLKNHRVDDKKDLKNNDLSSFPRANECVGSSKVLTKMDLVYAAAANNSEFAYFAVLRTNNNGDAGYYWLLTRKAPKLTLGASPCKPAEKRLTYDISGPAGGAGGDVLLKGHFKPSADPLLVVYRATADMNGVDAVQAIDFTSGLWALDPSGVAAVAVNTSDTAPGLFGAKGVKALTSGGDLQPEVFAEAAVPMSVFTGTSPCGSSYYASVISRSSGSGGTSPDLKDLLGPVLFNFGSVDATPVLTPSCEQEFGYGVMATGPDGQPLANPDCEWDFSTGQSSSICAGTLATPVGTHDASVTVTDPITGCSATVDTASVDVYATLNVTADLTATCESTFDYDAIFSGGSGGVTYAWTFSGGGTTDPSGSNSQSGSVAVGTPAVSYNGDVTVTDNRTDIECISGDDDDAIPYAPITVQLDLRAQPGQCPSLPSDAVTYDAVVSGGNHNYTYSWHGVLCSDAACTVDPPDSNFCFDEKLSVTVSDTGICRDVTSETEHYSKETTIKTWQTTP